jgi:hypothetical protein
MEPPVLQHTYFTVRDIFHTRGRGKSKNTPWALCIYNGTNNVIALLVTCFDAGFLLGLFSDPEDGGDMFLRNAG